MKKLDESTEETQEILTAWRKEARDMTMENLPAFLEKIMKEYIHDYGTICHAISIGGVATMFAINNSEQGGITGFQAGAVMWENIQNWDITYRDKPLRLLDYSDMLYPQYSYKFQKSISPNVESYLLEEAKSRLVDNPTASTKVRQHWEDIAGGKIPFGYVVADK